MQNRLLPKVAVVGVVGVLAMTGCSNSSKKSNGGGLTGGGTKTNSSNQTYKIGFQGPLSGDNQQLGINEVNATELAVNQANSSGKLGFKLVLVKADDVGSAATAPAAAATLIQDPAIIAVIGPSFSGATKAVGKTYAAANMPVISPSATNPALTSLGFTTWHRIVPSDNVEGTQAAAWFARKGLKKVFVIDDLSDYGKGVADTIQRELKIKSVAVIRQGVDAKTTDYGAIAQTVATSGADAVFYGGYDAQAAIFAKAIKSTGYKGLTVTGNGGKSSVFTKGAGAAGNGWYFTCGCLDATVAPEAKAFTASYTAAYKTPPSTYSPEAFDATNAMIDAIKTAKAKGPVTRQSVEQAVNALDFKGITTQVKFETNGEVVATAQIVNLYVEKAGNISLIGNIKDQK